MVWYVERARDEKKVKIIMNAEMQVRRPVGKLRTRWKDVFRIDLERSGLSVEETAAEALDRDRWRTIVMASYDCNVEGS